MGWEWGFGLTAGSWAIKMGLMAKVRGLPQPILKLRRVFGFFGYLLVVWGFYRLIFKLPDEVEELILKPLLWLVPTFWLVFFVEKRGFQSIGWTVRNLFQGVYLGTGMGMIFVLGGFLVNFVKYGQVNFAAFQGFSPLFVGAIGLSLATAVSEETVFRGYILRRLREVFRSQWVAIITTSVLFVTIYLPVGLFASRASFSEVSAYLFFLFLFSVGGSWVYIRTGTVVAPVVARGLWSLAIFFLFR